MNDKRFIFIGNRPLVLQELLEFNCNIVDIFCTQDAFFKKYLQSKNISYTLVNDRDSLIEAIGSRRFDVLISNGCPYILPVSRLRKAGQIFVNIHPSFLPDLKGKSPISGTLLYDRPVGGATCHIMDDGIDTGPIITQIKIDITPDIDLGLLYELSFAAEAEVFKQAYDRGFRGNKNNKSVVENPIYYSRKKGDMKFSLQDNIAVIIKKTRAFNIEILGAHFEYRGELFKVKEVEEINNPYVLSKIENYENYEVMYKYDNSLVVKKAPGVIKLKYISGNLEAISPGDILER